MKKNPKKATATWSNLQRIFTLPESKQSVLSKIEKEISKNIEGFLSSHIVAGEALPAELEREFSDTKMNEDPVFVSEHADFLLEKIVSQSVHISSPSFIGHMTSAVPYFMLPLAKIMIALNQNLVKIETSKAFTPLEKQVIGIIHRLVYKNKESFYNTWTQSKLSSIGSFCSGGTIGNITALWVARNKLLRSDGDYNGVSQEGVFEGLKHYNLNGLAILVSKRGHYSLKKAADLLSIGKNGCIAIECASDNKININHLKKKIMSLKERRIGIVAVVGIAGTTETGNIDPLNELADICKKENIWFHVDAAWGGPTLFSKKYKHLLSGIERADSVCFDAHKQLYVPVGAGIILFKNQTSLNLIEQHSSYVARRGSRDLGQHTLEGSRNGIAMLVHSSLKIIGRKGYELLINNGIEKARFFARLIKDQSDFELTSEPELNLLTYRYVPESIQSFLKHSNDKTDIIKTNNFLNDLTINIQREQRSAGKSFVSRTSLDLKKYGGQKIVVFRVALANPLTTKKILLNIISEQKELGQSAFKSMHNHPLFKDIVKIGAY